MPTPAPSASSSSTGDVRALDTVAQVRLHEHRRRRAVGQHVRQPLRRVGRVQRHVRAARLQHRQQRDHHLQAALHADPHPRLRAHAERAQMCASRFARAFSSA